MAVKSPLLVIKKGPEKSLYVVEKLTKKALPLCERELYKKSLAKCVELVLESPTTVYPL